jgi:hypothetical protein
MPVSSRSNENQYGTKAATSDFGFRSLAAGRMTSPSNRNEISMNSIFERFLICVSVTLELSTAALAQWSVGQPGTREPPKGQNRYVYLVMSDPLPGRKADYNDVHQRTLGACPAVASRLNALPGEQAYPNRVRGVWEKIGSGGALPPFPTPAEYTLLPPILRLAFVGKRQNLKSADPSSRTRSHAGRSLKIHQFSSRSRTFVRIRFAPSCGRTCGRRTIGVGAAGAASPPRRSPM